MSGLVQETWQPTYYYHLDYKYFTEYREYK